MKHLSKSLHICFFFLLICGTASAQTYTQGRAIGVADANFIYNTHASSAPCDGGNFDREDNGAPIDPFDNEVSNDPISGSPGSCTIINHQFFVDFSIMRSQGVDRIILYQGTAYEQYWQGYVDGLEMTVDALIN